MKKNTSVILTALFVGVVALAPMGGEALAKGNKNGGFNGPTAEGGYTGPGPKLMTMKEGATQADDTWVTFRGKIVNHLGDEKYTFQDASGTGTVEIDRKAWRGVQVGPNDEVELLVEVDKDWGSTEFEAKTVKIVNK